jgi:hypothetical protein
MHSKSLLNFVLLTLVKFKKYLHYCCTAEASNLTRSQHQSLCCDFYGSQKLDSDSEDNRKMSKIPKRSFWRPTFAWRRLRGYPRSCPVGLSHSRKYYWLICCERKILLNGWQIRLINSREQASPCGGILTRDSNEDQEKVMSSLIPWKKSSINGSLHSLSYLTFLHYMHTLVVSFTFLV